MVVVSQAVVKHAHVYQFFDGRFHLVSENKINPVQNKELIKFFFKPFNRDERFSIPVETFPHLQGIGRMFELTGLDSAEIDLFLSALVNSDSVLAEKSFLSIIYYEDCVIDDEVTDVIGISLFESKEHFLSFSDSNDQLKLLSGCSHGKMPRGLMVFNSQVEDGYQCLVVDKKAKAGDESSWSGFLNINKVKDNYFQTQTLINNVQEFAQSSFEQEESSEKIALINESLDYLKNNEFFDQTDYQEKVLQQPELIEKFEAFSEEKSQEYPQLDGRQFELSKPAISKTKRYIRSVIKLDKNFHVYVHGNRENIIRGFDQEKNKHFYTLFYDEEN